MEEPPFLPGPCSPELAQQRMQQCTGLFVYQLMSSREFHDVINRRRRWTFAWRGFAPNLLGLITAVILSFATLRYYARNVVDTEWEALASLPRAFEDLACIADSGRFHTTSSSSSVQSRLPEKLLQAASSSSSAVNETSQAVAPVSVAPSHMPATSWQSTTPASACALGMFFMSNELSTFPKMPMATQVLNSAAAVLPSSSVEEMVELPSVDMPAGLAEVSTAAQLADVQAELSVGVIASLSVDVASEENVTTELTEGVMTDVTEGVTTELVPVLLPPAFLPPAIAPLQLLVLCCAHILVIAVAVVCLAALAAANLDLAFVFTDNVGVCDGFEPWITPGACSVEVKPDGVVAQEADTAAPQLSTASQRTDEQLEDEDTYEFLDNEIELTTSNDAVDAVAAQMNGLTNIEIAEGLSALATSAVPSQSHQNVTFDPPTSPLLNAQLYTEAGSVARAGLSPIGFHSLTPMAMAMLTPDEPPSPFPGFPALSGCGVRHLSLDHRNSNAEEGTAIIAKTANLDQTPEHHERDHDYDGTATPPDSNATSWGSGSSAARRCSIIESQVSVPRFADEHSITAHACDASAPAIAGRRATMDPGVTPWTGFVWVNGVDMPSSSASGVPRCGNQQPSETTTPVSMDDPETIFDLNRFNEDGEEVIVERKVDIAVDKMSATLLSRRQVKLRFPSRKPAPRSSDVRQSDVLSAEGSSSSSSGGAQRGANRYRAEHRASSSSGDVGTPTWPPKTEVGAEGPAEPDVDDAVMSEAVSLANSLSAGGGCSFEHCGRNGASWSATPAHGCITDSVDGDNLLKTVMEPGREYAVAATAARMWLGKSKGCAKDVVLTACAGNEAALQTAQVELHSVLTEILNLDLTPSTYTASSGACKALAYSSANTPNTPIDRSPASQAVDSASWASIGSRVAPGSPVATPVETEQGVAQREFSHVLDSGGGVAVDTDVASWSGGPGPLPEDIDIYIASTRSKRLSPSESIMTGFQETLAYTGLLLNAVSSQLATAQARLRELEALHVNVEVPALPEACGDRFTMALRSSSASLVSGLDDEAAFDHEDGALAGDQAILLDSASPTQSFDGSESFEEFQTPVAPPVPTRHYDGVDPISQEETKDVVQQLVVPASQGTEASSPVQLGLQATDLSLAMDAAHFFCAELGDLSIMRSGTASCNAPSASAQPVSSESNANSGYMASRVGPAGRTSTIVSLAEASTTPVGSELTTCEDVACENTPLESMALRELWWPQV